MNNKPSVAELAKTLLMNQGQGVISTLSTDGGFPFGSVIDYLPLSQGDVIVLLNQNAEHYRYLRANSKTSLLINAHLAEHEAQHVPRATLLGNAKEIDANNMIYEAYRRRHPDSSVYLESNQLHFFQIDVTTVRYMPGSGRPSWIDASDYRSAKADPLGHNAEWLMHELNRQRDKDLIRIARNLMNQRWTESCHIVSVDQYGFDMICSDEERQHAIRISFDELATDSESFDQQIRKLVARSHLMTQRL